PEAPMQLAKKPRHEIASYIPLARSPISESLRASIHSFEDVFHEQNGLFTEDQKFPLQTIIQQEIQLIQQETQAWADRNIILNNSVHSIVVEYEQIYVETHNSIQRMENEALSDLQQLVVVDMCASLHA